MQFDKDLQSEYKVLFLEAREYLLSFEGIQETKKERITTYADNNGGICHIRTMPYGIDFGFLKGIKMEDKFNFLTGTGKAIRVLSLKEINKDILRYYIEQAIKINANKQ